MYQHSLFALLARKYKQALCRSPLWSMQSLLWAPHPEGEISKQAQAYYSRHQGDRKTMLCPNTSAAVSWVQGPFSPPAPSPQRWLSQLVVDAELWCVHSPQAGCIVPHLFLFCFFPGRWDKARLGLCGVHRRLKSPPKPAQPASWLCSCPCKFLGAPRGK